MPITVLLADDHDVLRQSLRRLLKGHPGISVVAEASNGIQAVEAARDSKPNVAVVDVKMPEMNGLEATAQIRRASPQTAVLILSMYNDERYVHGAVKAGAVGYLLKDSVEEELIPAIEAASQGEPYFSPATKYGIACISKAPSGA